MEPDDAEALTVRGNALVELSRLEDALASYDRALALTPHDVPALYNRGNVLVNLHRHDEALASYRRALDIDPDCVVARYNDSLCRLLVGDLATGWRQHEWRLRNEELKKRQAQFCAAVMAGGACDCRQDPAAARGTGIGRYDSVLPLRKIRGGAGREGRAGSASAAAGTAGADGRRESGVGPRRGAAGIRLSLPAAESCHWLFIPRWTTFPPRFPYLRSDPDRVHKWEVRLGPRMLPRVGLTWSGRAAHANDSNRSIALGDFAGLVPLHAQFVSLQKDLRAGDAQIIERRGIKHFGDELEDFAETAALIELMDIIITVDTSVAHLAAAMGKTVWILLPFNPDWRWLLDRDDSPWYPTARLFRQPTLGAWDSVIQRVSAELNEYLRRRS
jgi:tetratricopeptide (TPR) repeat protein